MTVRGNECISLELACFSFTGTTVRTKSQWQTGWRHDVLNTPGLLTVLLEDIRYIWRCLDTCLVESSASEIGR